MNDTHLTIALLRIPAPNIAPWVAIESARAHAAFERYNTSTILC